MDDLSPTGSFEPTYTEQDQALDLATSRAASLRSSLSMLSGASAELAAALEKRNQEYDTLLVRQSEFTRRIAALQTELDLATAERAGFKEQVNDRNAQLVDLRGRLDALQRDLHAVAESKAALEVQFAEVRSSLEGRTAEVETLNAQLSGLQTQVDAVMAARAEAEGKLAASQRELDGFESSFDIWRDGLQAALPAAQVVEAPPEPPTAEEAAPEFVLEEAVVEAPELRRSAKAGAVATTIAAVVTYGGQREQTIGDLSGQLTNLQAQLDATQAAKAELDAKFAASEAELAGLEDRLTAWQDELNTLLPQAAAPEALPAEEEGVPQAVIEEVAPEVLEVAPTVEEGVVEAVAEEATLETPEARRVAKVGAMAAAVAAVVERGKQREVELGDLASQKAALESALQDKSLAIEDLNARIERLNGSLSFTQAQLDGTLALKLETEEKLRLAEEDLDGLENQFDTVQNELQGILPPPPAEEAPVEAAPAEPRARRVAKAGAVAAAAAAVASRSKQRDVEVDELTAKAASLDEQINALASEKASLETNLQEKEQTLTAANQELVSLEDQLNGLAAEKASLEASLQERDATLAEFRTQVEGLQVSIEELQTRVATLEPYSEAVQMAASFADLPAWKRNAATTAVIAGSQPQLTQRLQGLNDVRGIGPAYQQRLYNGGVGTFWELATLSDQELQRILGLSESQLQRVNLDKIRASAYTLAVETGSVGHLWQGQRVDDFEELAGIGRVYEERLYAAGICTFEQLAAATVEQLTEICHAPEMQVPDYASWIATARGIIEERQAKAAAEAAVAEAEPPAAAEAPAEPPAETQVEPPAESS